jgi:putative tryptophan/tyrosine transport system substrate-binding protein
MRRRDIIAGLLVAAAFGRAQAQPTATKIPRIGYHAEAVVALSSSLTFSHRARLADLAREHRLPSITGLGAGGFLLSYAPNINAIYRQCAGYVDKILKGPSDLPVQQPTKIDLIVDLKTAETLGITIPSSILVLADEVIE